MNVGGYCAGCGGEGENHSCSIARCSIEHNVQFCCDCREYPCERYDGFAQYDSFLPCSRRQKDFERVQGIGLFVYIEELIEKRKILDQLLTDYNDGRRKTFFLTAVYLLDIEEIKEVMGKLNVQSDDSMSIKDKAGLAVDLFQKVADADGISLKLNKKPAKPKKSDNTAL